MSLYDIMDKKPKPVFKEAPSPIVEAPVKEVTSAAIESEQATQVAEPTRYKHTSWWETPGFVAEQQKRVEQEEKRMELEEKRAKQNKNMALLGDLARLATQAYAKAGGATRVDLFTPATEKANDKLAALRERHAAQLSTYHGDLVAARQAEAADRKKRNLTEAQMEQAEQERRANTDYRRQQVENEKERIKIAQQNALAKPVTTSSRVGSNKSLPVVFPDGTRKAYTKDELGENWINLAYEEAVEAGMPRLMNHRIKYNSRGRRTGLMEEEETNAKKRLAAIQQWSYENSLRNTAKVPVQKKANPMGSGKKANPMN